MTPSGGYADLGFGKLDTDRLRRLGAPETVFSAGKPAAVTVEALRYLVDAHDGRAVLATRCDDETLTAASEAFGARADVDATARTIVLGDVPAPIGTICVVSAGTSDAPVAREAAVTARVHGSAVTEVNDVGVAGVHRLLDRLDVVRAADACIVVAGMEGALPSVMGGLVGVPLVAVPTSIGYGWSMDGLTAFLAMLNSCAPGVTVVNVDNGFGAGVAAARIATAIGRARHA